MHIHKHARFALKTFALILQTICAAFPVISHAGTENEHAEFGGVLDELAATESVQTPFVSVGTNDDLGIAESLKFEPDTALYGRSNMQNDISLRGASFENSGISIANANIYDPQTGHYAAEIPVPEIMLKSPEFLFSTKNNLRGFNSASGCVSYDFSDIENNALSAKTVIGSYGEISVSAYAAAKSDFKNKLKLSADFFYNRAEVSGPFDNTDSLLNLYSGRINAAYGKIKSTFFYGYQSKNYGWPNMYVPSPFGILEYEALRTNLFLYSANAEINEFNKINFSAYYRKNNDLYTMPTASYKAEHETNVYFVSLSGQTGTEKLRLNFKADFAHDNIQSTGLFTSYPFSGGAFARDRFKIAALPEWTFYSTSRDCAKILAGLNADYCKGYAVAINPAARVEYENKNSQLPFLGYLDFAKTSQAPSYTAIGGRNGGPFGGNPYLPLQHTLNTEGGVKFSRGNFSITPKIFYREDCDLTEWGYEFSNPFQRRATAVNGETFGIELECEYEFLDPDIKIFAAYIFTGKTEDWQWQHYDASFYFGDWAKHRAVLKIQYNILDNLKIGLKNELRFQEENQLRSGTLNPVLSSIEISYVPNILENRICISAEISNLFNSSWQPVAGVRPYPRCARLAISIGL